MIRTINKSNLSILLLNIPLVLFPATFLTPIKMLCIFIAFLLIFTNNHLNFKLIIIQTFYIFFFLISLCISYLYNPNNLNISLRALSSYMSIYLILVSILMLLNSNKILLFFSLKTVYYSLILYMAIKFILIVLTLVGVVDPFTLKLLIKSVAPGLVVQVFLFKFLRIVSGNDLLILLFFPILLKYSKEIKSGTFWTIVYHFLTFFHVILSLTRFFWGYYIIVFLLWVYLYKKKKLMRFISVFSLAVLTVLIINSSEIIEVISIRMNDMTSLKVKSEQSIILFNEFSDYIFWGKGIGAFVESYLRSEYLPFIYEAQWISLLLQFGLIGFVILIFPLFGFLLKNIFKQKISIHNLYFSVCFFGFLLSGFTNPNLFIMNIAIYYPIIIYLIFEKDLQ